jgi:hypothetical protein
VIASSSPALFEIAHAKYCNATVSPAIDRLAGGLAE